MGIVGLVGELGYVGNCLCSSDIECRRESETGITFPYLNANESKGGIMNYLRGKTEQTLDKPSAFI